MMSKQIAVGGVVASRKYFLFEDFAFQKFQVGWCNLMKALNQGCVNKSVIILHTCGPKEPLIAPLGLLEADCNGQI